MATIGIINGEVDASKAISETDDELVIPAILAREAVFLIQRVRRIVVLKNLRMRFLLLGRLGLQLRSIRSLLSV